ncbi:MAG: ATP-dependent RecD-like DNA helicase [Oscillospiraceae bacterium]|jgi:exodeoxyribonuclease V alpha subunit|nr:ATP-dependent RecD-like DNA helicase [Oscillospiraceae bacterium]
MPQIELSGSVAAVIYRNEDNGYAVLRFVQPDGGETTVVGSFPAVQPGEQLTLHGSWTNHPAYGSQFKAERVTYRMPRTSDEIFSFLASGAIKGVGANLAKSIVSYFGEDTLRVLEEDPHQLVNIKGITGEKAKLIAEAFSKQRVFRKLAEFFDQNELDLRHAMKLYHAYGDNAVEALRENPYLLGDPLYGAKFEDCDKLAKTLGFAYDSLERVQAAVVFVLRHNTDNGHVFLPTPQLAQAVNNLAGVPRDVVEDALEVLYDSGELVSERLGGEPVAYLRSMYVAEVAVAETLAKMSSMEKTSSYNPDNIWKELNMTIEPAQGQRDAVTQAATRSVLVLTGGPGTGKTTTVRAIITLFDRMGLKTALAAPTGRAAKRMAELCGRDAQTIHRLLEVKMEDRSGAMIFNRNRESPLPVNAVVLDEISMVDIELMHALLEALKPDCRLILVGDADQLPSVGPGNVFRDIIASGLVPTVRLTEIFRQAAESLIIRNAHRINSGIVPENGRKSDDFFIMKCRDAGAAVNLIEDLCVNRLPRNMGIAPDQIQVLTPTRINDTGTHELNRRLQFALNPPEALKPERQFGSVTFRVGDRVMQIRNNYELSWKRQSGEVGEGVFNGDVGTVTEISPRLQSLTVDFEDKLVEYAFEQLTEIEHAFATTVHKAQGSEYRAVVLALMNVPRTLASRSILYTAVTRARELLVIVGDENAVAAMTQNDRPHRRFSALGARMTMAANEARA